MILKKTKFASLLHYFLLLLLYSCHPNSPIKETRETVSKDSNYFIGSSKCQSCHSKEFNDWQSSDHFLAMQEMNDSSVLGNFQSSHFNSDGVTNHFTKKNQTYFLSTEEMDGSKKEYTLKYTFGYFPLQQYLVETEGGRLQSTRVSWNSRDKKWFHQYPGQKIHPNDWLHWTGNSQNWNTMCASCHSTNFKKNYDFESDTYKSTYSEINVSCESCHGAGAKHVAYVESESFKKGERTINSGLFYAKDKNNQLQLNTCASCHARKVDISADPINSNEIMDDLIPELISNEHYFADGQINDEDYEYGSFTQSKMFHKGVKCSDCHNPHSGKILKKGNDMCMSCHKPEYNSESHHFHKGDNESTQCVNCHMPQKTYMGNDHRRDHSFRIPRPDQSIIYKTPNTCNSCHTKKSAAWASEKIKKWYGPKRAYHFSDDLLPGSLLNEQSESHLIKLSSDTSQPEIARATAIFYLGSIQTELAVNALLRSLIEEKAMLRFQALRMLENYPPELWANVAAFCLKDKVRAVRIAAADLYHRVGESLVPQKYKSAYYTANQENKNHLHYQRDFSVGNVMSGDYDLQQQDYVNAVKHYLRGLKKDSLMNYARFNLSAAYSSMGKNTEALKVLKEAAQIDPKNDRVFYNLALLNYEMGDKTATLSNFKKAYDLNSQNSDLYYNYGLVLQQNQKSMQAEQIFLKGFKLQPNSAKLNYALSYFYMQKRDLERAKKYATQLYRLDPKNSDYQNVYLQFGLK
jgi:tetratricopeptide (TPR) repeat protein